MDIPFNVNQLEPILQNIISQNVSLPEDDVKLANTNLKNLLLELMETEMERDDTFRILYKQKQYVGSYYEKLRVGQPNEFDINLELELPIKGEHIEIITNGTQPGFAKVKVTPAFKPSTPTSVIRKIKNWVDDGYLNQEKILSWLQGIVAKAIVKVKWPSNMKVRRKRSGPAVTLLVTKDEKQFDVDLVPVFMFGRDKWPSQELRQAKSLPRAIDVKSLKWCVVPKAPRKTLNPYEWRMSFYMIEKQLMKNLHNMKPVIKLLKLLRDMQEMYNISSYYIKTLFMWELVNNRNDEFFWQKGLSYLFMHMLNKMEERLEEGKIPFFWHDESNLIEHLHKDNVENMLGRIRYLKRLIHEGLSSPDILTGIMENIFSTPDSKFRNRRRRRRMGNASH